MGLLLALRNWFRCDYRNRVKEKKKRQIVDKIMDLIEICNFADEFSLLFNPTLGLCS